MAGIGRRAIGWGAAGAVATLGAVALAVGVPVPGAVLNLDAALPPGISETHRIVIYHALSGRTVMSGLELFDRGTEFASAGSVSVASYRKEGGEVRLRSVELRDAAAWTSGGERWTAGTIAARGVAIVTGTAAGTDSDGFRAWAKRVTVDDLSAETVTGDVPQRSVTIGTVAVDGYAGGAMGHLVVKDTILHLTSPQAPPEAFNVREIEVRNSPASWALGQRLADLGAEVTPVTPPPFAGSMTGIALVAKPFFSMTVDAVRFTETLMRDGSFHAVNTAEGGMFHFSGPPAAVAKLRELGLDQVAIACGLDVTFDASTRRLLLNRVVVSMRTVGVMSMSGSVVIDHDAAVRAGADTLAKLKSIVLEHGSIRWEDGGMVNRMLGVEAAREHTGVEIVRQATEQGVQQLGGLIPDQPDLGMQLVHFIAQPHALVLNIDPPLPVALGALVGMPGRQAVSVLGLRVLAQ